MGTYNSILTINNTINNSSVYCNAQCLFTFFYPKNVFVSILCKSRYKAKLCHISRFFQYSTVPLAMVSALMKNAWSLFCRMLHLLNLLECIFMMLFGLCNNYLLLCNKLSWNSASSITNMYYFTGSLLLTQSLTLDYN